MDNLRAGHFFRQSRPHTNGILFSGFQPRAVPSGFLGPQFYGYPQRLPRNVRFPARNVVVYLRWSAVRHSRSQDSCSLCAKLELRNPTEASRSHGPGDQLCGKPFRTHVDQYGLERSEHLRKRLLERVQERAKKPSSLPSKSLVRQLTELPIPSLHRTNPTAHLRRGLWRNRRRTARQLLVEFELYQHAINSAVAARPGRRAGQSAGTNRHLSLQHGGRNHVSPVCRIWRREISQQLFPDEPLRRGSTQPLFVGPGKRVLQRPSGAGKASCGTWTYADDQLHLQPRLYQPLHRRLFHGRSGGDELHHLAQSHSESRTLSLRLATCLPNLWHV